MPINILEGAGITFAVSLAGFAVLCWLDVRREKVKLAGLERYVRDVFKDLPQWCSSCALSELVCDLHPRTPFEDCDCGEGVPRACPACQASTYDVTALLEEIARLRAARVK